MAKATGSNAPAVAGGNWAQLKKKLYAQPASKTATTGALSVDKPSRKQDRGQQRRDFMAREGRATAGPSRARGVDGIGKYVDFGRGAAGAATGSSRGSHTESVRLLPVPEDVKDARLVQELRAMVVGETVLNEGQKAPGNYVAIDCEMVGLGPMGRESALARISVVNYHGHVLLDTHVAPREAVTDYRTWISGIRPSDLLGAPGFDEVQAKVAALVDGRIVVGHALENDFKALLLSHPAPLVRDTQTSAPLRERAKTKRPGLAKLAALELGIEMQKAAHSPIVDARATMALYRLHKVEWEKGMRGVLAAWREKMEEEGGRKRKRVDEEGEEARGKGRGGESADSGGGRRGISSNIGLVITHKDGTREVRRGKRGYVDEGGRAGAGGSSSGAGGNWWEKN